MIPVSGKSLQLGRNERIVLVGDSITEARMHSCILESYLTMCRPDRQAEIRNLGKGGETATQFLVRLDPDCLSWKPTLAVVSYGMNDSGYSSWNRDAVDTYGRATRAIIRRLQDSGCRIVLCSPGCIGRLPPWPFLSERNETLEGLNDTLRSIRDEGAGIAIQEGVPFVDQFEGMLRATNDSVGRYGERYAVCGAEDGVHPSWAGHVVMAFGILSALGLSGDLASFRIDAANRSAAAGAGHRFLGVDGNAFRFRSVRYPFCSDGPPDRDESIPSGMTLVPFQETFNRWMLTLEAASATSHRVTWTTPGEAGGGEGRVFTGAQLARGVDLSGSYRCTPFQGPFRRIEERIRKKQAVEVEETWHAWESESRTREAGLAEREAVRDAELDAIRQAFVPVDHVLRIEVLP
jgi:lysophospholipase L1-like esterase